MTTLCCGRILDTTFKPKRNSMKTGRWKNRVRKKLADDTIENFYKTLNVVKGNPGVETYQEWLAQNLDSDSVVGIDPKLIDSSAYLSLSTYLSAANLTLKSIEKNLVDLVWTDKALPDYEEIVALPYKYSGRRIAEKLVDVRREIVALGAQSHIVTALDDIACKLTCTHPFWWCIM